MDDLDVPEFVQRYRTPGTFSPRQPVPLDDSERAYARELQRWLRAGRRCPRCGEWREVDDFWQGGRNCDPCRLEVNARRGLGRAYAWRKFGR